MESENKFMTLKSFDGAVAVITGGASGIGLATAKALYAQGAHVVLADRDEPGLQQAVQRVSEQQPTATAQVLAATTDVTDQAQVQAAMRQAQDITGRIDLVVACAGVSRGGAIDDFPAAAMQAMLNINVMGIFHTVQAAIPTMRQQQSGHFVLTSSVAGKLPSVLLSGYCASKWAVRGFSSSLRAELYGTGIGITTVYPAFVDTPMVHQEDAAEISKHIKMEILLKPEQVADAILEAVLADQRDLTLAPNADIALLLDIMKDNPDKAEDLAGKSFSRHMQQQA